MAPLVVRPVPAETVRPLRSAVLRPGTPPEALVYPGDDHPLGLHVAAFDGEIVVGIATVYPEPPPAPYRDVIGDEAYAEHAALRLRGMATAPALQGRGVGRRVLERCFEHGRTLGATVLWCNARTAAVPFYEAMGLARVGPEFEIAGIGPHFVMWRRL